MLWLRFSAGLNYLGDKMITILQGTLGSGKSATATAMAFEHLKKGGVVATNFAFKEGWAWELSKHSFDGRFRPAKRLKNAQSHYDRHYMVNSLEAVKAIKPKEQACWSLQSQPNKYQEGQGLLILDECQLIFNSRKWQKNDSWVEFFTQTRKMGWDVLLVAHDIKMIDSQIQPLIEFEARFRNLQKVRLPIIGLPLSPFPMFAIIYRYAGLGVGASVIAKKDLAPLPTWAAQLYDSMQVFSADKWFKTSEPIKCGSRPEDAPGADSGFRVGCSSLSPDCLWTRWETVNCSE